jgi:hypothetical protein
MYSHSMLSAVLFASFVMQAHQKFQNGHIPNAVVVRIHGICAVFLLQTLERNAIIHLFKKLAQDCHLKCKKCVKSSSVYNKVFLPVCDIAAESNT